MDETRMLHKDEKSSRFSRKQIHFFLSLRKLATESASKAKASPTLGMETQVSREAGQDKCNNRTICAIRETIVRNNSAGVRLVWRACSSGLNGRASEWGAREEGERSAWVEGIHGSSHAEIRDIQGIRLLRRLTCYRSCPGSSLIGRATSDRVIKRHVTGGNWFRKR